MSEQTEFFEKIKAGALLCWEQGKILPSITGAQAALESNWGRSTLATEGKNLFGIKAGSDWTGEKYYADTGEYINGKWVVAKSEAFRKYPSWADSVRDHGIYFTENTFRTNNYKAVPGETDYKKAVAGMLQPIAQYSYATDPGYYTKVVSIIEQYELYNWDKEVLGKNITTGGTQTVGKIIFIDDGHGGNDNGAMGNGILEDAWNLEVCAKIESKLAALGHKVLSSRSTDVFVGLSERAVMANNAKADIFISCHVNAGGGQGYEDFIHDTLSGSQDAALQNAIHAAMVPVLSKHGVKDRGKKKANFAVLRETKMPAILTEAGFLDNAADAEDLKNPQFKEDYATAIVNGVQNYFGLPTTAPSAPAATVRPSTGKFKVGEVVKIRDAATNYQTGQVISSYAKSKEHTIVNTKAVTQSASTQAYLLGGINSWVLEQDLVSTKVVTPPVTAPVTAPVTPPVTAPSKVNYKACVYYGGYSIDSKPWGTTGAEKLGATDKFLGEVVDVTEETASYVNTSLGWIDKRAMGPVPTRVTASYNIVIKNGGYSIDTKPWGEPGATTTAQTVDFIGKTLHVSEENGGGQYVKTELGWIDKRAVEKALTVIESILFLPNGKNWVIYPENGPYSVGDVISVEGSKDDGGLYLKIEGDKGNNILVVDLPNEGRVGIYFNEENDATITRKYA